MLKNFMNPTKKDDIFHEKKKNSANVRVNRIAKSFSFGNMILIRIPDSYVRLITTYFGNFIFGFFTLIA